MLSLCPVFMLMKEELPEGGLDPWVLFCFGDCFLPPLLNPWWAESKPLSLPAASNALRCGEEKVEGGRRGAGGRPGEAKLKMKAGEGAMEQPAQNHVCITSCPSSGLLFFQIGLFLLCFSAYIPASFLLSSLLAILFISLAPQYFS